VRLTMVNLEKISAGFRENPKRQPHTRYTQDGAGRDLSSGSNPVETAHAPTVSIGLR